MAKSTFTDAYTEFRALLKNLRVEKGLSQVEVARRLAVPQSYVSKVETGERRLDFVETIAFCEAIEIDLPTFAGLFEKKKRQAKTLKGGGKGGGANG